MFKKPKPTQNGYAVDRHEYSHELKELNDRVFIEPHSHNQRKPRYG